MVFILRLLQVGEVIGGEFRFQLFDAGQIGLQWLGERLKELVFGDSHGLGVVPQSILGDDAVLAFAEQQADGGLIVGGFDLRVHGAEIEV